MSTLLFDKIQEGSVANILQFLTMDKVTGCLQFDFGTDLPKVYINYVAGKVTTAEFGIIYGDQVLCLLMCQESSLKTIEFLHQTHHGDPYDRSRAVSDPGIGRALIKVATGMDTCPVRSSLYGMERIHFVHSGKSASVLQVLHDFDMVKEIFSTEPVVTFAPVHQCALFQKALSMELIEYKEKFIKLSELRPLIAVLEPLQDRDRDILVSFMRKLMPHTKANSISIEGVFEFADLLEACAEERGREILETVQFKIFQLLSAKTGLDVLGIAKLRQQKLLEKLRKAKPQVANENAQKSTDLPAAVKVIEIETETVSKKQPSFMQLFFDTKNALPEIDS